MGLSVIIASAGRPTLLRTLASVVSQLLPGDELLVDVNDNARWGYAARNRLMMKVAPEQGMLFMDDDDIYLPGALACAREAFAAEPDRVHIFRIVASDGTPFVWQDPALRQGNVSTQCFLVPQSVATEARWSERHIGDYDFLVSAVRIAGEPRFHEHVVAALGKSITQLTQPSDI